MSRSLRSHTLKSSFHQLSDFLRNGQFGDVKDGVLLSDVERHYNWLQCVKVEFKDSSKLKSPEVIEDTIKNNVKIEEDSDSSNSETGNESENVPLANLKSTKKSAKRKERKDILLEVNSYYESDNEEPEPKRVKTKAHEKSIGDTDRDEDDGSSSFRLTITVDKTFKLPWTFNLPKWDAVKVESFEGLELISSNVFVDSIPIDPSSWTINGTQSLSRFEGIDSGASIHDFTVMKNDDKLSIRSGRPFIANSLLTEYVGEVLNYNTFRKLDNKSQCVSFIDGYVIDGSKKGSAASFIRHSHSPNCGLRMYLDPILGQPKLGVFVKDKDIEPDTEITVDYNDNRIYRIKPERCFCGSKKCTGFVRKYYKKLVLINLDELVTDIDGNALVREKISTTEKTKYPKYRLKEMATYGPQNEDPSGYFYVVGVDTEMREQQRMKRKKKQQEEFDTSQVNDSRLPDNTLDPERKKTKSQSTNGSEEFQLLPARLKKQLGIDMVTL